MRRRRALRALELYFTGVAEAINRPRRPLADSFVGVGMVADAGERLYQQGYYDARNARVLFPDEFDVDEILRRAEVREAAGSEARAGRSSGPGTESPA